MKNILFESNYKYIEQLNIWINSSESEISYSDGDHFENNLIKIFSNTTDLSTNSLEIKKYIKDWPTLYHLSNQRANLLRPFKNELENKLILEVGCGCGAITRYLAEINSKVIAIDGSKRRSIISRLRTKGFNNIEVLCESFKNLKLSKKFDYILLVGVLEYANLFFKTKNPSLELIKHAKNFLKKNGKIIIAIENKLGLKYLNGTPEDHIGKEMYGIENLYLHNQPKTFGKIELSNLIKECGFKYLNFFIPYPDYKITNSIISESFFHNKNFDFNSFIKKNICNDPQLTKFPNFSTNFALQSISSNNLLLDLANSFLVFASENKIKKNHFAIHYSTNRQKSFCKETIFTESFDGKINVDVRRLYKNSEYKRNSLVSQKIKKISYVEGEILSKSLEEILIRDNWSIDQVYFFYLEFFNNLKKITKKKLYFSPNTKLPGDMFDCIPSNIIINEKGHPSYIDNEWIYHLPLNLDFLFFRSLCNFISTVDKVGNPYDQQIINWYEFIFKLFNRFNWNLNNEKLNKFISLEENIQSEINGINVVNGINNLIFNSRMPIYKTRSEINNINEQLNRTSIELSNVYNSFSWKLTKPLRFISKFFK